MILEGVAKKFYLHKNIYFSVRNACKAHWVIVADRGAEW